MERYLLDTNILVYMISAEMDNISLELTTILDNYDSQLFTSSVSIIELQQLYRIKKIRLKNYKTIQELILAIEKVFFITILPFGKPQISSLSKLNVISDHNDPFDHAIISHAISDNLILVSSDKKFDKYINQKLKFVYNKR